MGGRSILKSQNVRGVLLTSFNFQAVKDPFGDDPFANLHAPTRPESPSPALPPKKAKQPPPRPAPPRPSQAPSSGFGAGPMRAAPAPPTPSPTPDPFVNANSDPFAAPVANNNNEIAFNTSTNSSNAGFADFANFDAKVREIRSLNTILFIFLFNFIDPTLC